MKNSILIVKVVLLLAILNLSPLKSFALTEISTYSINSVTIKNLKDNWIDQNTAVFIELDDVIILPKSKMFHYNDNPYRLFIQNLVNLAKQDSKYLKLVGKWYQDRKIKLVEEEWKSFIQDLKAKNVQVYGFCTMPIELHNIEEKRFTELKDLGIIFTDKVGGKEVIPLPVLNQTYGFQGEVAERIKIREHSRDLQNSYVSFKTGNGIIQLNSKGNWSSVFYHGIIFTGPFSKAASLLDFIKITNISPKKILVIDNVKNDLQQINKGLKSTIIGFKMQIYSVLYLGARQLKDKPDPTIAELQQKTLLNQGRWIEDEDVKHD